MAPESAIALGGDDSIPGARRVEHRQCRAGLYRDSNTALRDRDVRHAINLAIDRDGLSTTLFAGLAPPANAEFRPTCLTARAPTWSSAGSIPSRRGACWRASANLSSDLLINPTAAEVSMIRFGLLVVGRLGEAVLYGSYGAA